MEEMAPLRKLPSSSAEVNSLSLKFPIKEETNLWIKTYVWNNCLAKVVSKLYLPQIGIAEKDDDQLPYLVPAPGYCYFDLLFYCDKKDACPFKHTKEGDNCKKYFMTTLEEDCIICCNPVLKNEKIYGVLDNCEHIFCLKCIW